MSTWTKPASELKEFVELAGRPVRVYAAIVKILGANLPPLIAHLALVPSGRLAQITPKRYQFAGEELPSPDNAAGWPVVLVGGAIRTEDFAMGWENQMQVNITCAWAGPTISRRQLEDSLDVVTAAAGIFRHPNFNGHFEDPDDAGAFLWYGVVPNGYSLVPTDWQYYSGYIAHLVVRQAPESNLW